MNLESILLGFLAGLAIGAVYLSALWLTVRRVASTGRQSLLLVSFVARIAVLLLAFYGLIGLGAQGLVAALLGFIAARAVMTRVLGHGPTAAAAAREKAVPADEAPSTVRTPREELPR